MEHFGFCSVTELKSSLRFVCFSRRKLSRFSLSLTDASDVWTKDLTDDETQTMTQKLSLESVDELCQRLRSLTVQVEVQEDQAQLRLVSGSNLVSLNLTKMAAAVAAQEVKELLFKMADLVSLSADNGLSTKSLHRRTDFEPRQQNSAPLVTVKKRLPGASLINPGTKKKRAATGVAFDDPDD